MAWPKVGPDASSAASAANAVVDTVHHIVHDTPAGKSFSVARASEGEYGVDKDLIFSLPMRSEGGILKVVTGITHNAFAQEKIKITLDELRSERDAVKSLGLVPNSN